MKPDRNWNKAKWIFKPDGSLKDIYVQDVDSTDWNKLIEFLNSEYNLIFGIDNENGTNRIDFDYVQKMWNDETGKLETKSLTIDLNGVIVKSYFFCPEQIEFDIKPAEIKSESELNLVLDFMQSISKCLKKQSTLTEENQAEFPLIKVDYENGIEKVLTEKESEKIWKNSYLNIGWFKRFKNKYFAKRTAEDYEYLAMESACKPFEPVPKENNVW